MLKELNDVVDYNRVFLVYGGRGNEEIGGKMNECDRYIYIDIIVLPGNLRKYCLSTNRLENNQKLWRITHLALTLIYLFSLQRQNKMKYLHFLRSLI